MSLELNVDSAGLAEAASAYASLLNAFEGHQSIVMVHKAATNNFGAIYQEEVPGCAGVYIFQLAGGDVFYIGRADCLRTRIWQHIFSNKDLGDGGRGFPDCVFCHDERLTPPERESVRRGNFRLDYLTIEPAALIDAFEVHLQAVFFRAKGRLPACNSQFG